MRNSSFRLIHIFRIIRKVSEIAKLSKLNEIARRIMRILRNSSYRLIHIFRIIRKVSEITKLSELCCLYSNQALWVTLYRKDLQSYIYIYTYVCDCVYTNVSSSICIFYIGMCIIGIFRIYT